MGGWNDKQNTQGLQKKSPLVCLFRSHFFQEVLLTAAPAQFWGGLRHWVGGAILLHQASILGPVCPSAISHNPITALLMTTGHKSRHHQGQETSKIFWPTALTLWVRRLRPRRGLASPPRAQLLSRENSSCPYRQELDHGSSHQAPRVLPPAHGARPHACGPSVSPACQEAFLPLRPC